MESSIAGMLILSVLIVTVVLMSRAYVVSNTLLGTAIVESVNLADERSRTEFSIDSVTDDQNRLTIAATNTGSVPITDFDKMDLFVGSQRLVYATSTPVADMTWTVSKPQNLEPRRDEKHNCSWTERGSNNYRGSVVTQRNVQGNSHANPYANANTHTYPW